MSTPQTALQLLITGYSPSTTVTVTGESLGFQKVVTLGSGQTVPVQLPASVEMVGGGLFNSTIVVEANNDVSILALNYKHQTADSTVVYPLESLGNEYYIVTPREILARVSNSPEFAVVAGPASTTVQIHLKGLVFFRDRYYNQSSPLSVTLRPYQAIQLQSRDGFSGTRVSAQHPVAVLSGHSCISLMYGQSHVVEQLLPVSSWGSTFVVPPLGAGYFNFDRIYIIASQSTHVRHQRGEESGVWDMAAGDVMEVEMGGTKALSISASAHIQVLYYSPGGENYGTDYAPFIMNVPPVTSYCPSYHLGGLQEFDNYIAVIAENSAVPTLTLDKQTLGRSQWHPVDAMPYLWSIRSLGKGSSSHVLEHPSSTFGVLSFGVSRLNSYGSAAVCAKADADSPVNPTPSCDTVQCRKKETCRMVNGSPVCVAQSSATCWLSGDPHYKTFDGRYYDFMGTCTYTVAKTCGSNVMLPSFTVEAKNENRGNTRVSYAGFVTVRVYNVTISVVRRETGFVRVNAQRSHLPISLLEGKLKVYQRGVSVVIETDFSLRVSYDWNSYLVVQLSSSFWEHVCGLCGNYNGDARDDFATPAGTLAASPVEFGKSWKVEDGDRFCWDDCHGACKSCSPELVGRYKAEPFCGWITKEAGGPFSQCHSVIDPKIYLDNCVYDLCMNDGLKDMLCQALASYADACRGEGVDISDWRMPAGCPLPCPENSQYQLCGSVCPATCNERAAPNNCSSPCVETCQCNEGFVLDAGKCIHKASCGCEFQGHLYGPGEPFWGDSTCTRRCICDPQSRQVSCQATGCRTGEQCRVENGIQNCYPSSYGTCSASGDPHYTSFDGQRFDFQGSCQYQLAGRCQEREELVDFQVLVQNDHRSHRAVSFIKAVEVRVYGLNITVSRDYPGRFLLNGSLINLPYSTDDGKISVYQRGQDAAIQTDFHLTFAFDWHGQVTLTAPSTYAGALCGLCGNFNGDKGDELTMKDGRVAPNATAFGQSWRVAETPDCTEADKGCFCNAGFLLSGDRCVPVAQCGCVHQGRYYRKREEFYASASCQEWCRVIECWAASCGANEQCRVENGVLGCHTMGCGKCTVAGDSHYLTSDGQAFDFQGSCTYTLAKICSSAPQLVNFSGGGEEELWPWSRRSDEDSGGLRPRLCHHHGEGEEVEAQVDGELYTLPLAMINGKLRINLEGNNIIVQSASGLKVLYDTSCYVLVSIPSSYKGHVCGLCGNFNGDKNDDFLLRSGKSAQNADEFGASWKVPVDGATSRWLR
ncbi:IgGFc-binding protein-like [Chrysemys picta bellii]|uniref:IgGFc-binding protein-like n=1 Tax=Chrysemys picta bellii TaxID=8478 RepID=UPI0032B0FC62